jgi:hypothetical protein
MTHGVSGILRYQQLCFRQYSDSVGLPVPYVYVDGNPVRRCRRI